MHAVRPGLIAALLASSALLGSLPAQAQSVAPTTLPSGASVAAGRVTIAEPSADRLAITQDSDKAIVNWRDFSIGSAARVDISQPDAQSALLNRVTGDVRSTIAGALNANGQVFLINPNGIVITSSGTVTAAGFTASALDIADKDFLAGSYRFAGNGASAAVANHGRIAMVGRGGYAALIGGQVTNSGLIAAPLGRIGLGAGERATLDFAGDGFLQVAVPSAGLGDGALVTQSGRLTAEGGLVVLSAASAREAARQAVNLSGVIEARSVAGHNGAVVLSGGEGAVAVSGRIDASALAGSGGTGGAITITGGDIALTGAALVDASGESGGGTIRIGGDRQGLGSLAHAGTATVDAATVIRADATRSGSGGDVVVWSDAGTTFAGTISATGIARGGDAEVSGKALLAYTGHADLRGGGGFGTLLLDPYDVTISSDADSGHSGFAATADDSVINVGTLLTALDTANVVVSTGSGGTQAGNITVGADLAWTTNATLTFNAAGSVTLDNAVTARAGGLTLSAGGAITTGAGGAVEVARFTLQGGAWTQNGATLPGFASADFRIAGGSFLRAIGGDGTSANPWLLTDIYGVQGIATYRSASFGLANDIDAALTRTWNGNAGFAPVGDTIIPFSGTFDGAGHAISNLVINRGSTDYIGLFGTTNGAMIANVELVDASITGQDITGALIGYAQNTVVSGSEASGAVKGRTIVGGLIGDQFAGTISRSRFDGAVNGNGRVGGLIGQGGGIVAQSSASGAVSTTSAGEFAGGLVGYLSGSISQSWSDASVSATFGEAGGLVGSLFTGSITQSWASGAVSAPVKVGGLVGEQSGGNISQSWASGAVSGSVDVGGLVGSLGSGGILTGSFWDIGTTRQANATGITSGGTLSATGLTTAQARQASSYAGWDFATIWYQAGDLRPILRSMAAPADGSGTITVSNLYQLQLVDANLAGHYVLTGDIDASSANGSNAAGIWGPGGFVPIGGNGDSFTNAFTGSFDGAGHVISNLTVHNGWSYYVGLFGYADSATIANLGLADASMSGTDLVGPLVAYAVDTTISQSWASGSVNAASNGGGLVGLLQGGSILSSWSSSSVDGDIFLGGLVGELIGGSISDSWASGAISGSSDVGGLVGLQEGAIDRSWASGAVHGDDTVGGLVGEQFSGSINQAWASGAVSGSNNVGGLLGSSEGGTVTASYWDMNTTGQSTSVGGTGLTTAQARRASSYAGWDFAGTWYQAGDMRPILRSMAAPTDGDGNIAVSNIYQLQLMGANLAGHYVLTGDIDASLADGSNAAGVWGTGGFVPVGNNAMDFRGIFNGAGHVISNLKIDRPTNNTVGLFGYVTGATITDLGLADAAVTGGSGVGSLAGFARLTTIDRSWMTGAVGGADTVGGLVGGQANGSITQSWANATVSATDSDVGGLLGSSSGTVSQSWAAGTVSGTYYAGGLVGTQLGGTISQSWASASAHAASYGAGGLVGSMDDGTISQSWASGAVSATYYAGGLLGSQSGGIDASFWDMQTSGVSRGVGSNAGAVVGLIGLTTAQFQDPSVFMPAAQAVGWDFEQVWAPPSSGKYPTLYAFDRVVAVDAGSFTQVYGDASSVSAAIAHYYGLRAGDFVTALATLSGGGASANVGTHAVTVSGGTATDPGYRFVSLGGTVTVTPRPITVTADAASRIYGDANPALTYTVGGSGLVNGDTLAGMLATSAAVTSGVGDYAITQGSLSAGGNYMLTYVGADLTVTARPITVTADALSRIYGNANPALTYAITSGSLVNGDGFTGALATSATATSGLGTYAVTQGTLAANSNYVLTYAGNDLTITARPITVTVDALSRIYGDTNPALTYTIGGSGLVNGDALSGALTTAATAVSGVGAYGITQGTLAASANYALTYAGADLTVTARPITVTADAMSRIYGDANPVLSYAMTSGNLVNGDGLSGVLATSAAATSDVGTYAITQGTLTAGSNYALTYAGADLTVTARPITVAADAASRVYGDANPALTYGLTSGSLVNGDALTGVLATSATGASGVGTYAITQGTLTAGGNYALAFVGANLAVTARPITVTADAVSRIYGDANPALGYAITSGNLVNGDGLSGVLATSAAATSDVGTYAITQGTLTAGANYALTYNSADLTITARPITVTADAVSRIYGDANPALAYALASGSLVNGDTLAGALATGATAASDVGDYAITQGTLAAGGNYALTYVGADLTVTARPITVTADALSRIYGNANPVLTFAITSGSLVNGDGLSGALATSAAATSGVGTYAIAQGTLSAGGNYALTFAGADLTITARPITVAADALSRVYGDANPALTYTIGGLGLVNGDGFTGTLATSASTTSGVGDYAISQGTLSAGGNYALTYRGADLTVTARPITVTADALSRIYGDANPMLSYTIGGSGLVNGDTLAGGLATSATLASDVGAYAITQGTLAASANYALTYIGADLDIAARPITVTADALSRIYGNANPALTYRIGGKGLANGDTLAGALATDAVMASNVGSYAITQGTQSAGGNYALTYIGADLTVTARPITITADALSRVYGDANPALTYAVGGLGLANGDALTGALATAAIAASGVGAYAIMQGTLAANANYALTFAGADLTITPRPITVLADALSRIYGDANPALTYRIGGMGLVNGDTLAGTLATDATPASNVGGYAITQGSLSASANYALTYAGAQLTVDARPLVITPVGVSRVYGDANPVIGAAIGDNLVNGDTIMSVTLASPAALASGIGRYALAASDATGAGLANYAIRYAPLAEGLTVTARPITITADALSRAYGDANPALTYAIGGAGLVNGDALTGALSTDATATSAVGEYAITQGTLSASANYALTYAGANLTIMPRAQTDLRASEILNAVSRDWLPPTSLLSPALPLDMTVLPGSLVLGDPRLASGVVCFMDGGCFRIH